MPPTGFQLLSRPLLRGAALILALSLVFSAPAFALRQVGLEESRIKGEFQSALLNSAGLEEKTANSSNRREWIGRLGVTALAGLVFLWTGVIAFRHTSERDTPPNPKFIISQHQQIGSLPVINPSPQNAFQKTDTLEKQLQDDPGFFGWFVGASDEEAAQTREDMALYIRYLEYRNQLLLQHAARTLGRTLSEADRKEPPDPHYADYYRDQIASDPARLERFKRTRSEVYWDLFGKNFPHGIDLEGKIDFNEKGFSRNMLRFLAKLWENKDQYGSLKSKLAGVSPDQKLSVVLGRLPILFGMVQDRTISVETATTELQTALESTGSNRLFSHFSELLKWAALNREERDPEKIRPVLVGLAELLRADDFFMDPYLIIPPPDRDPFWKSLVLRIVYRGNIGEREVVFIQRVRGGIESGRPIPLSGYHHYASGDQKEISVVLMDEAWDNAQLVHGAINEGSYAVVDWSDFKNSERLQKGIAESLRRFVKQGELPSDLPSLWRLNIYNAALHEHTHALGNPDEYWTHLVEMAVGHSGIQMPDSYSEIYGVKINSERYKQASTQLFNGMGGWRLDDPSRADSPTQLRGIAGALLLRDGRSLFDYFSSSPVQKDLQQLRDDLGEIPVPRKPLLNRVIEIVYPPRAGAGLVEERFLEGAIEQPKVRAGLSQKGWAAVPGGYLAENREFSVQTPLFIQTGLEEPDGLPKEMSVIRANETTVGGMLLFLLQNVGEGNYNLVFSSGIFTLEEARAATPSSGIRPGSVLIRPGAALQANELGAVLMISRKEGTIYIFQMTEFTSPDWKEPLVYIRTLA